jgi:serine/threonine protein kinase
MHGHYLSAIIMDLDAICEIYEGSKSSIHLAKNTTLNNAELVALKSGKPGETDLLYNEANILIHLRTSSRWFPKFRGILTPSMGPIILMEVFTGGDLLTHLEAVKRMNISDAKVLASQLICAVETLHSLGYIHRNLKPDNIMFTKSGDLKLIDFGLCHRIGEVVDSSSGSVDYMAPEILSNPEPYTESVDYWSIGVILYEILFGGPPFSDEKRDRNRTIYRIIHSEKYLWFPTDEEIDIMSAISLIKQLLNTSPVDRSHFISKIKDHSFFLDLDWDRLPSCKLPPFNLLERVRMIKSRKQVLSFRSG